MKLSAIKGKPIKSFLLFGDEKLNFVHDPTRFTPRLEIELNHDGDDSKRTTKDLATYISRVVTEWDLTDDDGNSIPLTVDALIELPIEFLGEVVGKINEDNDPNKNSSEPSGSFS